MVMHDSTLQGVGNVEQVCKNKKPQASPPKVAWNHKQNVEKTVNPKCFYLNCFARIRNKRKNRKP